MNDIYIDVETFSSVDIMSSGAYAYTESIDFEILILCYKINDRPIKTVDLASGENIPLEFLDMLQSPYWTKHAHNAAFERLCFKAVGYDIPIEQWECSAVKAAYCGLPLSLDNISKAMKLGEASKDAEGKALIRYFSIPVKPTKINGGRTRNLPHHNPEKWEKYKAYCKQDVHAEYTILQILKDYHLPKFEHEMYNLDQLINDRGIKIDTKVAAGAIAIDTRNAAELYKEMQDLTGLANPNSPAQLKQWLSIQLGTEITTISKDVLAILSKKAGHGSVASEIIKLRAKAAKTSIKKYKAMIACLCLDGRAHGLFQFYGANRTGRWAGRLIQLQNLPQNKMSIVDGWDEFDFVRTLVREGNYAALYFNYDDLGSILSQLVRTAFVPEEGSIFGVADFSAIEARVIAWLASEQWRLDVFNSHGMIYEASASKMFSVDLRSISYKNDKGEKIRGENYDMRAKGKVAELALGYGGSVGAMITMGGEKMGLSTPEMQSIVDKWRAANPAIVALWKEIEKNAILAVRTKKERISKYRGIKFNYDGYVLTITLPSGRALYYQKPTIGQNRWGGDCLYYWGMDQVKKIWTRVDTYGGKLVENIVQAIARDLLAESLIKLDKKGFDIVMHVHDEVVAELLKKEAAARLEEMCAIMSEPVAWAEGLPLAADGYVTEYYKKDTD
jgi:DNA polymerase